MTCIPSMSLSRDAKQQDPPPCPHHSGAYHGCEALNASMMRRPGAPMWRCRRRAASRVRDSARLCCCSLHTAVTLLATSLSTLLQTATCAACGETAPAPPDPGNPTSAALRGWLCTRCSRVLTSSSRCASGGHRQQHSISMEFAVVSVPAMSSSCTVVVTCVWVMLLALLNVTRAWHGLTCFHVCKDSMVESNATPGPG
jgi:hypothetical protein